MRARRDLNPRPPANFASLHRCYAIMALLLWLIIGIGGRCPIQARRRALNHRKI